MFGLSVGELFFYGGLLTLGAAVIGAIANIVVFLCIGKKLKRKLEKEYGKPQI